MKTWSLSKAGTLLCLLLLCVALPAVAGEIHPKLRAALQAADSGADIPVIVRMAEQADLAPLGHGPKHERLPRIVRALKEKADVSQRPVRDMLCSKGGKKERNLWIINGLAITVTPETVEALAAFPGVASVQLDETVPAPAPVPLAVPTGPVEWNLTAVHAPELWNLGYTGQGVVVAGMDGGVDPNHLDLKDKWRGGTNSWYDPNGQYATPFDQDGHGTATMSVMVGGNAGGSVIGMAPDARWIAVKIFPDAGPAPYSAIHAGFQWLLDPDDNPATADAPDVVNNSWGLANAGGCVTEFQTNVQTLRAAGIAVVFAAGNSGPNTNTSESPGNYPESFAVGAVDRNLNVAGFSSRGPSACGGTNTIYPELAAPGVHIRTAGLTFGGGFPDSYSVYSGTSFASPHVAGAMALLLSAFPALSVPQLEAVLSSSATDRGTAGADQNYGQGLLNVFAAYSSLLNISVLPDAHTFAIVNVGSAAPPQTFTITNRNTVSLSLVFGQSTINGSGSADFSITGDGCSGIMLAPDGTCTMTVVYHPFSEGTKNADLVVTYSDPVVRSLSIPLSGATFTRVTLLTPNGGTIVPNGGLLPITWGAPLKAAKFNLAFSVDNGGTWWPIKAGVTGRSYNWPVPLQIANRPKTLVRVRGINSKGIGVGWDRSDTPLAIEVVKLTAPNGGEVLASGTIKTITWATNTTKRPVASVRLWFTLNGGVTWQSVTPLLSGNPGRYDWRVPTVTTARGKCRVKVVLRDAAGYPVGIDSSDAYFTIQPLPL